MTVINTGPETIKSLLAIMSRLRDPDAGCPWDLQQDFKSIAPYTLEEAYEVVDALESNVPEALQEELGDLLFQIVFHSQLASEAGWFDFNDVVAGISNKMLRRHPHVFSGAVVADVAEQTRAWERHKQREKGSQESLLDGVPAALPALTRADKLQKKAARAGFDWPVIADVFAKVEEELGELRHEIENGGNQDAVLDEAGDVLFAVVNLVRFAGIDPESALRHGNRKFTRRFKHVEVACKDAGVEMAATELEQLTGYWEQAKAAEKTS